MRPNAANEIKVKVRDFFIAGTFIREEKESVNNLFGIRSGQPEFRRWRRANPDRQPWDRNGGTFGYERIRKTAAGEGCDSLKSSPELVCFQLRLGPLFVNNLGP
jgi:hypothetical protein